MDYHGNTDMLVNLLNDISYTIPLILYASQESKSYLLFKIAFSKV